MPAPALPPAGQLWARIRQAAASEGIAVPLVGAPPFNTTVTPPQYRALLGAWGPGAWQGNTTGDKTMLIIQSVDGDGNVQGEVGSSLGNGGWCDFTAPVAGNRFAVHLQLLAARGGVMGGGMRVLADDNWQIEMRPDGTLSGSRDNGASTVVLRRLQ